MKPFFVSIPHSGEKVPAEVVWLQNLPETTLMRDVDRYVDRLYEPALRQWAIPSVVAEWHRYVVDLNRLPDDVDQDSVEGAPHASGTHTTGFHWVRTTIGETLISKPMSPSLHLELTKKYFEPFHQQVTACYERFRQAGFSEIYHLDAHSMPSKGTSAHRDPGQERPQIVVSDVDGTSCHTKFKDIVIKAYQDAGFEVAYNWPYKGGRVTQTYGRPALGQNAIQVEMSRALYMDENTKALLPEKASEIQKRLVQVMKQILDAL